MGIPKEQLIWVHEKPKEVRRRGFGMAEYLSSSTPIRCQGIPVGNAEVGHLHQGGVLDISFSRSVRDALLAEALAEEHHWAPDSGWISFHMRKERDITHALWLMRLSYLRYALKINSDSRALLEHESEELHLAPRFRSLLEKFVPSSENASSSFPRIERDAADGRPY